MSTYYSTFNALYINQLKMTEVSVETCFVNLKVLSYSLKSLLVSCYQDLLEIKGYSQMENEKDEEFCPVSLEK